METLDAFTRQFLETLLWSETDNANEQGGEPFDANYGVEDLAPETIAAAKEDCADFQAAQAADLARAGDDEQNGHDFALTRNGHGAGFWDRGYGAVGERLTQACKPYGSFNLYLGDDGKIYQQ
jgi:hypothetical protein